MVECSPLRSSMTSSRSAAWSGARGAEQKVIDHQDADPCPRSYQTGLPSVGVGDGDLVEQVRART